MGIFAEIPFNSKNFMYRKEFKMYIAASEAKRREEHQMEKRFLSNEESIFIQ